LGLRDYLFLREKALSVSPAIIEHADRFSPVPLIATPPGAAGAIRDAFVEVQTGAYGWIYARQPSVRAVIDYIARNASQLGLHLYQRLEADNRQSADDHPAAQTMRRPNAHTGMRRFIFDVVVQLLCYDNAYALKFRQDDGTRLLMPIPSDMVGLVGSEHYTVREYRIYRPDGTFFDTPAENMIHWRGTDPSDPRQGVSKLETMRLLLAEDRAAQESSIQLYKAGMTKPGYIWRQLDAPELEVEDEERILEDWMKALKDPSTKPPMLHEGMEFRDFGLSPREAEMLDGRRFTREEVAAQYGMIACPPTTMEGRQLIFHDVIHPLVKLYSEVLDVQLVEAEYLRDDLYFEFAVDQMMESERIKGLVSGSGRPVLLTDEARAALDLPPVEGGDELVTPANVIVGSNPLPSQGVMPIQDPNKPSQDGDFRQEALPPKTKQLEITTLPRFQADRRRQKRNIDVFDPVLAQHFARQQQALKSKSNGHVKGLANAARWNLELAKNLLRALRLVVDREGGVYVARLGGDDFDLGQTDNYLQKMAEDVAAGINDATEKNIAEMGVEDAFARAEQRTASAAASLGTQSTFLGRKFAGEQGPNPEARRMIWRANTDRHQHLEGKAVSLDGDWNGIYPGSEPGCECSCDVI
jgi:HK97 family phage portal protein